MPGEPLTLHQACSGFRFGVVEFATAPLRLLVAIGWAIITQLGVQYLAKHLYIETPGEGQHLPELLRAAHALQMPAPARAALPMEELVHSPLACPFGRLRSSASFPFGVALAMLVFLLLFFPLFYISRLQCKLLLGRLVRLAFTFDQFPALISGEDAANVGDVLALEKAFADL